MSTRVQKVGWSALTMLGCAVLGSGCGSLTFSNSGGIDFERYPSVYVDVDAPDLGGGYAQEYLASLLRLSSGFTRVTTDPAAVVDVSLHVDVRVEPPPDTSSDLIIAISSGDVVIDDDEDEQAYTATAAFTATTLTGAVVDFGVEEDASSSTLEAIQDVLDQVDLHYMKPFRI